MGFAQGLQVGSNLVSKMMEDERLNRAEGRAEDEDTYRKSERNRIAAARNEIPKLSLGLPTDTPVTAGAAPTTPVAVPPVAAPAVAPDAAPIANAPPTSVAATAGSGVPPVPPVGDQLQAGLRTPTTGAAPPPVTPASPSAEPSTGSEPAAPAPAAAPATPAVDPNTGARLQPAPALSDEMKMARAMFNYARETGDVNAMNKARDDIRTTAMRDYSNQAGKMNTDEAFKYVHDNLTMDGGMPISVAKQGKNGYTMMSWDKDGDSRIATLNGAQIKQLVAADLLMKNGFADEGLKVAAGVHKDLNDLIGKMNASTQGQATTNNTATHYGNTEAETARHDKATEANAAAGLQLRRNAEQREKYQNADTWQDKDGNTYKSVMEVGKNGPQMKAFKIGGEDGSLQPIAALPKGLTRVGGAAGAGGADKAIPAAGTMMQGSSGTYQSDGKGGRISVNAPLPDQRAGVLKKAGFSGGEANKLTWTPDGEHVTFPGASVGYNVNDPSDMVQLQKDMSEAGVQRAMATETAARVATAPARRAARETQMDNLSDPNRFGPGVGLPLLVRPEQRALYVNTDE